MNYLIIEKTELGMRIQAELNGEKIGSIKYIFMKERDAIADYRKVYNLKGKRLQKIYI